MGPSVADASWPQPIGPASLFVVMPPQSTIPNYGYQTAIPVSPHTGGINVSLGDGSVHFVAQGISGTTWWYAMTPAGGEILGSDW